MSTRRLRTVGVLGGMGPEATVLFMQRLIAAVPAGDDSDHVPLLVDSNTQVPSRISRLIEGRGEDPGPVLVAMARRLEAAGAEALAMPCNTAHHYARQIAHGVRIPFLNMIDLSVDAAARAAGPAGRVGILASPAVRRVGIFDAPLGRRGLVPVYSEDEDSLLAAIRSIKRSGGTPAARAALAAASASLRDRGAVVQLVACTEFSLIRDATADGVSAIDTLDALVEEVVRFAAGAPSGEARYRETG